MIRIENLTKRFGRAVAADDVSFNLAAGESIALWGPNGAGKTTIIRCLLALLRYRGKISVGGIDAAARGKQARRLIGYVPQELGFHDDLPVHEAIGFFATLKGVVVQDLDAELARVGLAGQARKRIRELSGGMKQRLALSFALQGNPPILVLDEVTASLDAAGRDEFVGVLSHLVRDSGRAVLFASHRLEEIRALANRVITLDRGKITADLSAEKFLEQRAEFSTLHLFLDQALRRRAVDTLKSHGFDASVNGRGIYVTVRAGGRGAPLSILAAERLRVDDFQVLEGVNLANDEVKA